MFGKAVLKQLSAYKQGMQIEEVQRKYNLEKIVKLASNENPYGYPENVKAALTDIKTDFEIYPDGYAFDLRVALADKLKVNKDEIIFGAGSDEVITFICRAFLHEGTNTVMATPTFPQYRHHALIEGAKLKEVPTINGRHDLASMLSAIDENTKVVWLCSPDNPSGELISSDDFHDFMEKCPSNVLVVLDEAYYEFVDEDLRINLKDSIYRYDNVVVLRTFSKIYGLAGLRVGYGLAKESLAEKLNIIRGPFNTTSYAQRIMIEALKDDTFIRETKRLNDQVRTEFESFLQSIDWHYNESHTNFLLVHTPVKGEVAAEYLLQHGFIVRSGHLLGYPNTLRITIGSADDMKALQKIIKKLHKEINDGVIS